MQGIESVNCLFDWMVIVQQQYEIEDFDLESFQFHIRNYPVEFVFSNTGVLLTINQEYKFKYSVDQSYWS